MAFTLEKTVLPTSIRGNTIILYCVCLREQLYNLVPFLDVKWGDKRPPCFEPQRGPQTQ